MVLFFFLPSKENKYRPSLVDRYTIAKGQCPSKPHYHAKYQSPISLPEPATEFVVASKNQSKNQPPK